MAWTRRRPPLTPLVINLVEGRSGSTLLMRSLDHPEIAFDRAYPYEFRYLTYLAHLLWPVGEPYVAGTWEISDMLGGPRDRLGPLPFEARSLDRRDLRARLARHAWAALSESLESQAGHPLRYYAEKALGDSLELLTEAGIRAAVVNLVRDPRDIVSSIRSFDAARGFYGFGREAGMGEREYLQLVLARMKERMVSMARVDRMHRAVDVRYEDLVLDRGATLGRLGKFLGLRLETGDVGNDLHGFPVAQHTTSADAASSVGRWRSDLSAEEAEAVTSVLGEQMARYGYR